MRVHDAAITWRTRASTATTSTSLFVLILCGAPVWSGAALAQANPGTAGANGTDATGSDGSFNFEAPAGDGGVGGTGGTGGPGGPGSSALTPASGTTSTSPVTGGTGGTGGAGGSGSGGPGGDSALSTAGNGGAGGTGGNGAAGGAGGAGALLTSAGASFTNTNSIAGGSGGTGGSGGAANGGDGGVGFAAGGNGGNGGTGGDGGIGGPGGTGVLFTGAGGTLTNAGTITGGNGGAAGAAGTATGGSGGNGAAGQPGRAGLAGVAGPGGIGVVGSGLTIDNTGGTIAGGFANAGAGAQTYAVQFTGGANSASSGGTYTGGIGIGGGSFQPALSGSAVGTALATTGPVTFAPGTTYVVRITPTANDRVNATGSATLTGATVNVLAGNGTYAAGTRTILTAAGGLGGSTFAGVTSNLAFLMPVLTYDNSDVFLTISAGTEAVIANNGALVPNYRTAAVTRNQLAVASGLTNAGVLNGGTGPILTALNQLTAPQAQAAFDSLSGEGIAATQNLAHRSAELFTSSIFDQTTVYGGGAANQIVLTAPQLGRGGFSALASADGTAATFRPTRLDSSAVSASTSASMRELADLPAPRPQFIEVAPVAPVRTWRAWGTGFGVDEDVRSNAAIGFAAQQNSIVGGSVGVDYQVSPGTLVGLAAGGTDGSFNVPNRATSGSTTGGHVGAYSLASFGPFYAASSLAGSFYQNRTTRTVAGFGGLGSETERGSFSSREVRARLEAGRGIVAGPYGTLTPFVALEVASLRTDGFTEQPIAGPGLLALNVSGQSAVDVPAFVGLRYSTVTMLGDGVVFKPAIQAAYVHEFAPERQQFAGIASLPGAVFLVDGARPARDAAQVKAGGELLIGPRTALYATFDGEFARASQLYGGKGGIKVLF